MRICFVSRQVLPTAGGGLATPVSRACRAFAAAGHEVHLLTGSHSGLLRLSQELPGVRVHVATCDEGPGRRGACRTEAMHHALAVHHTLRALHARHPFALVEFPATEGEGAFAVRAKRTLGEYASAFLAVRLHTPSVERQALNRADLLDLDLASTQAFEDASLREADGVVSPTAALLERVTRRLTLQGHAAVIPSPFAEPVPSAPPRERPGRARILYAGPFEYREGLHLLPDVGQRLLERGLDVEFLLLGEDTNTGPFGQSLLQWLTRRLPAAWRERFHVGPLAALETALPEAPVCCFPSLGDDLPDAGVEAMARGAVVVGSGGLGALIEEGRSGLHVPSGDVARLAEALERALTDESLRRTVRHEAPRRIATVCAPERFVADTLALLARPPARPELPRVPPSPAAPAAPAVSILVPYYNMGRYLPETLRSLREQTFEDYEILLVDDGSTEPDSQRLLATLEGTPKLRLVRKPNGGLSSARNAGLREARGRWILPLDPDDLIAPTFLEKAVAVMRRSPRLGYTTSLVSYFIDDPHTPIGGWVPWGLERDALCLENVASTCTALMERELVEQVGGYDEWLTSYEDWDVFCALAERGYEGVVLPEFLFHYRQRPDSMTRQVATQSRQALIAYLLRKHPELPGDGNRVLRLQLGEMRRQQEQLRQALDKPLRYRLVDQVNDTFKRRVGFVHHALRRTATRVRAALNTEKPRDE